MKAIGWPPDLNEDQLKWLLTEASTYALAHGLAYLPPDFSGQPASAIHAPFTLLPTPFPRHLFEQAINLQPVYNALYSRIACDVNMLDSVLGDVVGVGRVDTFTGKLWRGWKNLRDRGAIKQVLLCYPIALHLSCLLKEPRLLASTIRPISFRLYFGFFTGSRLGSRPEAGGIQHNLLVVRQPIDPCF